jgi:hypothetical protein
MLRMRDLRLLFRQEARMFLLAWFKDLCSDFEQEALGPFPDHVVFARVRP